MEDKKLLGNLGEELAKGILFSEGYDVLEMRYRGGGGEADIICQKEETLVVVEVKTRMTSSFGIPSETVTRSKIMRMRSAAEHYAYMHGKEEMNIAFQVFAIQVNQIRNIWL